MEYKFKNEIYIANNYKLSDYLGLTLTMQSSELEWEKAINIFIDRLQGRYFDAIKKLSNNGNEIEMQKYVFSIVRIQCLLIDTLVKFRYGPIKSKRGTLSYNFENERQFTKFLKNEFRRDFDSKMALRFYKDIRCGVVHFGTTKKNSRLTCDSNHLITEIEDENIIIAMNYICNIYQKDGKWEI